MYDEEKLLPLSALQHLLFCERQCALMRMEGYDAAGALSRRFEVISAQKIENRWFLKQMRIEQFQPGTKHVESRTYLEIKKDG